MDTADWISLLFSVLFDRNCRIHCFSFYNVRTCRSVMAAFVKNSTNKFPSMSQKTLAMTLNAEVCTFNFLFLILPVIPIYHPPIFQFLWSLKDALGGRRFAAQDERKNTACMKKSDALAKSSTRPAHGFSRKGGKSVWIIKETLWKTLTFLYVYPWYT